MTIRNGGKSISISIMKNYFKNMNRFLLINKMGLGFIPMHEHFQEHKNEMISCLDGFPIDTYGAAWLDDFGSGDLVRVTGRTAHNNLVTALADPTVLGIGHCPMLMHSMKMQSDIPCLAGLDMKQICEGDGIIPALVDRGIWSLKVHNDTPDEIIKKGPRANRILFYLDDEMLR